jgi:hypothetical protein
MRMRDIHNYTHAEKKKGANNIIYIYIYIYMKIKELMMLQLL